MLIFSYGSNMCSRRLRGRVPSAEARGIAQLTGHRFRFHKVSTDGSAKADACETGNEEDVVWGVLFEIDADEQPCLDRAEGLSHGYDEKAVRVMTGAGEFVEAQVYVATLTDSSLRPFTWYKDCVIRGARQHGLPQEYVALIGEMESTLDTNRRRALENDCGDCT